MFSSLKSSGTLLGTLPFKTVIANSGNESNQHSLEALGAAQISN